MNFHMALITILLVVYAGAKIHVLEPSQRNQSVALLRRVCFCFFFMWIGHSYTENLAGHIASAQEAADDAQYTIGRFRSDTESKLSDHDSKLDSLEGEIERLESQIHWR